MEATRFAATADYVLIKFWLWILDIIIFKYVFINMNDRVALINSSHGRCDMIYVWLMNVIQCHI